MLNVKGSYSEFMTRETELYSAQYALEHTVIHGVETLFRVAQNRGAILAPVHYGSYFFIGGAIYHNTSLQVTGIVTYNNISIMPPEEQNKWLDIYRRAIQLQQHEFFYAGKTSKTQILAFLERPGNFLWSMLDVREVGRERPEFPFEFLGRTIYLQLGTARLAHAAGVPILPVCIKYAADEQRHHLYIGTAIPPTLDEQSMTQQALHQIEGWIGNDMTQFFHDIEEFERPSPASKQRNGFEILFDQYSRYKACEELLSRAGVSAGDTLLDIGSGPQALFQHFLPGVEKTFVDPLMPEACSQRFIKGDLTHPALRDRTFSAVSAIDVLEHVPPQFRQDFLLRLSSLAGKSLILGFPVAEDGVSQQADERIDAEYERVYSTRYSWLDEHYTYGLPSLRQTVALLEGQGWTCQCIGHGHVPWLQQLLPVVITGWDISGLREFLHDVSRRFNTEFYPFDFEAPHYRYFVVCTRSTAASLAPAARTDFPEADARFRRFMEDIRGEHHRRSLRLLKGYEQEREAMIDAARAERDAAAAEHTALQAQHDMLQAQRDTILNSRSWRVTRPLRFLTRVARHGVQRNDLDRLVAVLRPWYRRMPIPAPIRRRLSRMLRAALARSVGPASLPWVPPDASIRIASPLPGRADYLVFGVIDWHFRHQRPQHLSEQLAAGGNRVFYVSVNFINADDPGFVVEPLDENGRLFCLQLHLRGTPSVYESPPGEKQAAQLRAGLGLLLGWAGANALVALVQHPFWFATAAVLPNSRLVYDCMDHHEGFGGVTPAMLAQERALLDACDLTLTTSSWIDSTVAGKTRRSVIVRNAADFDHFSVIPDNLYTDPQGRPIIGYYGAIAEWFDIGLVSAVAAALPQCSIVLIGADTVNAHRQLARYDNVTFLGEIPYRELPRYAHAFDVCLLPFKVLPLTLATNPVKVYEYLSMGKPVVSTDLPEVRQLGQLCRVTGDHAAFVTAVRESLQPSRPAECQARREFAQSQTWAHRVAALRQVAESTDEEPQVSVIVVTYNNLELTRQCLASIEAWSDYPNLEVIVVDNASQDGSPEWLRDWSRQGQKRQLILNDQNLGFAAANNQGLRAAKGDYLIMLNNDTYVTPGWVRTMVHHMRRDATLGLLGPVTNNIGNEARIDIAYDDMTQMIARAGDYTRQHMGELLPLRTNAFFCVMLRRETFEKVGPLDEAFGYGFFEDDDYCRRVEQAGLRMACAEDVFVHHHLSASFNKLKNKDRQNLFERNRHIYEAKWGPWVPHNYREAGSGND